MPKELVFVLDTSGSMSGFPIEKAKETMRYALASLNPQDTFNLITFSGDTHVLFPEPVPATAENMRLAQEFLASRSGGGGTEMMKAIRAALAPSGEQNHIRVVCFMTDGYVGNDMEIIDEVQRHPNARVFSFGIGSSVNRFLLDKMAEYGRGEVEYVGLNDDGSAAARRFHERVRNPLLTDIAIDWGGLPVTDVYPKRIPDLFGAKPLVIFGRYTGPARGTVRIRGRMASGAFARDVRLDLPAAEAGHDVLAPLWARARVDDLMGRDYRGIQSNTPRTELREQIVQLGINYRLMTQFTSFVAVEEKTVTEGGQPRRVEVPVEMPHGVSYEGVFGDSAVFQAKAKGALTSFVTVQAGAMALNAPPAAPARAVMEVQDRAVRIMPKLHPAIAALIERLRNPSMPPAAAESKFVRDGKAEVRLWLAGTSAESLAQLRKLGFEVLLAGNTPNLIIGRVPTGRLAELADLAFVRYIAPQGLM
jgi:Ca-activated chloride channel family protein